MFNSAIFGKNVEIVEGNETKTFDDDNIQTETPKYFNDFSKKRKYNNYSSARHSSSANARHSTSAQSTGQPKMSNVKCPTCNGDALLKTKRGTGRIYYACDNCKKPGDKWPKWIGWDDDMFENQKLKSEQAETIFTQTLAHFEEKEEQEEDILTGLIRCNCGHIVSLQKYNDRIVMRCPKSNGRYCNFYQDCSVITKSLADLLKMHYYIVKKCEYYHDHKHFEEKEILIDAKAYFREHLRFGFYTPKRRITIDDLQRLLRVTPETIFVSEKTSQRVFLWHIYRWLRCTGSKYGAYAWLDSYSSPVKTMSSETHFFTKNKPMSLGTEFENTTNNFYLFALDMWLSRYHLFVSMQDKDCPVSPPHLRFGDSGMIPNINHHYLGFSPDGLIEYRDPITKEMVYGVAEFKSVSSDLPKNNKTYYKQPNARIPNGIKPSHWAQVVGGIANLNDRMSIVPDNTKHYTFGDLFYTDLRAVKNLLPGDDQEKLSMEQTLTHNPHEISNFTRAASFDIFGQNVCQWERIQYNEDDWFNFLLPRIQRYNDLKMENFEAFLNGEIRPGEVLDSIKERLIDDYKNLSSRERLPYSYEHDFKNLVIPREVQEIDI